MEFKPGEQSILELVRQEPNVAKRILSWIKGTWQRLTAAGDAKTIAQMERVQKIYSKALMQSMETLTDEGSATTGRSPSQANVDSIQHGRQKITEDYRKGELTDEEYDAAMDEYDRAEEDELDQLVGEYSFEGYAEDGRGIYRSNFSKGTPKKAKGERILRYIQDIWSKKPITLRVEDSNGVRYIEAQFDPTYDEGGNIPTDASKLMGGNRHGNSAEQRVTLDLADDYYQLASESQYNGSKAEMGKMTNPHKDVRQWHYFVNDIYFAEWDSDALVPYRVSINVKERGDGEFFYSFSAEKAEETSSQRTLHAAVNAGDNASAKGNLFDTSLDNPQENVKGQFSFSSDSDAADGDYSDEFEDGSESKYSLRNKKRKVAKHGKNAIILNMLKYFLQKMYFLRMMSRTAMPMSVRNAGQGWRTQNLETSE